MIVLRKNLEMGNIQWVQISFPRDVNTRTEKLQWLIDHKQAGEFMFVHNFETHEISEVVTKTYQSEKVGGSAV